MKDTWTPGAGLKIFNNKGTIKMVYPVSQEYAGSNPVPCTFSLFQRYSEAIQQPSRHYYIIIEFCNIMIRMHKNRDDFACIFSS